MINQNPSNSSHHSISEDANSTAPDADSLPGNPFNRLPSRKTVTTFRKPQGWSDTINNGAWSDDEHARFMEAQRMFPQGPWRLVAEYVGTRTVRQVQTHMQKINEKVRRHRRGLHKKRKDKGRPSSEPIGSVAALVASSDDEQGEDKDHAQKRLNPIQNQEETNNAEEDSELDSGAIIEPIVLSPSFATRAMSQQELEDVTLSRLEVDGMEDVLNVLFDRLSS